MNVVDSSGWLEFLTDGPNAEVFEEPLSDPSRLVVPVITIYEVFKKILLERDETAGLEAVALMQQGELVNIEASTALSAAKLSLEERLPMADALILATARQRRAVLWTQDRDFEGLDGVRFVGKRSD